MIIQKFLYFSKTLFLKVLIILIVADFRTFSLKMAKKFYNKPGSPGNRCSYKKIVFEPASSHEDCFKSASLQIAMLIGQNANDQNAWRAGLTGQSARSFARTAHSFACFALFARAFRCAYSFARFKISTCRVPRNLLQGPQIGQSTAGLGWVSEDRRLWSLQREHGIR